MKYIHDKEINLSVETEIREILAGLHRPWYFESIVDKNFTHENFIIL